MARDWPTLSQIEHKLSFVNARGIRTRYLEAGDSSSTEAVVFLHGTGGHLEAFSRNIAAHAESFRTVSLDKLYGLLKSVIFALAGFSLGPKVKFTLEHHGFRPAQCLSQQELNGNFLKGHYC